MPEQHGYHKTKIKKGTYGEVSKILEEAAELQDAAEQNNKILTLVEICDLYGAIEGVVEKHYNMSMEDIRCFSDCTKRAFASGERR